MLGREARATQFVRAMVTLAQSLRLETVGEGVSTGRRNCESFEHSVVHVAQGHLFAPASEPSVMDRLLAANPTW